MPCGNTCPVAFDKVPAVPYKKYDTVYSVNPNTVSALKEYSTERIEKSADFAKRLKEIKLYEEQKAKKEIPLNEKKFLARRAEFDAQESEEKTLDEHERGATEVYKRDYYGNEVLSITLDYLRLLGKDKVAADARTTGRPN